MPAFPSLHTRENKRALWRPTTSGLGRFFWIVHKRNAPGRCQPASAPLDRADHVADHIMHDPLGGACPASEAMLLAAVTQLTRMLRHFGPLPGHSRN